MFGFGKRNKGRRVNVVWPSGVHQEWALGPGDHLGLGDMLTGPGIRPGQRELELKVDDAGTVHVHVGVGAEDVADAYKLAQGQAREIDELHAELEKLKQPTELDQDAVAKQLSQETLAAEADRRGYRLSKKPAPKATAMKKTSAATPRS